MPPVERLRSRRVPRSVVLLHDGGGDRSGTVQAADEGDVVDRVLELSDGGVPWTIDAVGRPETMRPS